MKSLIIWASVFAVIGAILFGAIMQGDVGDIFLGIWLGGGFGCSMDYNRTIHRVSKGETDVSGSKIGRFFLILITVGGLISFLIWFLIKKKKAKFLAVLSACENAEGHRRVQFDRLGYQLGNGKEVSAEIAYREYQQRNQGESVKQYFERTSFDSLPEEVQSWYFYKEDLEKCQ